MSASEPLMTYRKGFKTLSERAWGNNARRSVGGDGYGPRGSRYTSGMISLHALTRNVGT
jgi:hypothetical protein